MTSIILESPNNEAGTTTLTATGNVHRETTLDEFQVDIISQVSYTPFIPNALYAKMMCFLEYPETIMHFSRCNHEQVPVS